jgi:hypothetical protein
MDNRTRLLETALLEYVERYGATENARRALIQCGLLNGSSVKRAQQQQSGSISATD